LIADVHLLQWLTGRIEISGLREIRQQSWFHSIHPEDRLLVAFSGSFGETPRQHRARELAVDVLAEENLEPDALIR